MKSLDSFRKVQFQLGTGESCEYYVYPKNQNQFDRVLVYLHGLLSDIHWFEIPAHLPKRTGILFLPRHPRTHVDSFETWTRNYDECFLDFKKNHLSGFYHLLGHCFGTFPALHWATIKPEHFTTLTLVSPPFHLKKNFGFTSMLGILLGEKTQKRRCLLTPRAFARLPEVTKFIEQNPTTTFYFSNAFYLETARLQNWLRKNVIAYPAPVHYLYASEDEVIQQDPHGANGELGDVPDETTFVTSDHYAELLPNKDSFWNSVFKFQLDHEIRFEIHGNIKKILVTGATGFLGSHIVRNLLENGREPVLFVRNPQKARAIFSDHVGKLEIREGDMDHLESMGEALQDIDAVVHTAAYVSDWDRKEKFDSANVVGTKNLLMMAHSRGIKQFIHISSLGIFGDTDQDNMDENHPPVLSSDPYSNSKIRSEIFVRKYSRANKIPFTILRPGFIYGEGDNHFFPNLIRNLREKKFRYVGSKDNILNTVYVGNVAALVNAVIGNKKCLGETYHIADRERVEIGTLIRQTAAELGLPEPEKVIPKKIAFAAATVIETLYRTLGLNQTPPVTRKKVTFAGRSRSVNAEKAYHLLGGLPFPYEEGIKRTLESFKQ